MSIILAIEEAENVFVLQEGSFQVQLDSTNEYINYTEEPPTLSPGTIAPSPTENELFIYTEETVDTVLYDVYDFKENTIVYGGNSIALQGLLYLVLSLTRNILVKNLTIKVEDSYTSMQGFLIRNFETGNILVNRIENCHVFIDVGSSIGTPGLIGDYFKNGTVIGCSYDYTGIRPFLNQDKGGICGSECGASAGINADTQLDISRCFSTCNLTMDSSGGIVGLHCGNSSIGMSTVVNISECYSTGNMGNSTNGGICGRAVGRSASTNSSANITITFCYSTGNISGGGGICAVNTVFTAGATNISTLTITSCYSTGAGSGGSGGICANAVGDTANGASSLVISCCYALDGEAPVGDFATGGLVAGFLANPSVITSIDNSFSVLIVGGSDTTGRISMTDLEDTCGGVYEPRCVFDGEALILSSFLDCDIWRISEGGIDGEEACVQLFAPGLGYCGCPLSISEGEEWPVSAIGTDIVFPCVGDVILSRHCNNLGNWDDVVITECSVPISDKNSGKLTATIIITMSVVSFFIVVIIILLLEFSLKST